MIKIHIFAGKYHELGEVYQTTNLEEYVLDDFDILGGFNKIVIFN